ncbi:very low-density lipoprotein receptor-like [Salvelinus namaycush]|uniref:Very low-density lipoprotein receptor-like n=1 Tax=Salvelinus namaycush TaxID=8040 RepID=A0A8U1BGD6_SALNM|nr:very low-density lipoprotein receptor-like [Salvelinus namaycush]
MEVAFPRVLFVTAPRTVMTALTNSRIPVVCSNVRRMTLPVAVGDVYPSSAVMALTTVDKNCHKSYPVIRTVQPSPSSVSRQGAALPGNCPAGQDVGPDACPSGQTRAPHTCFSSEFSCGDGQCMPHSWRCDHSPDCADASDEDDCVVLSMLLVGVALWWRDAFKPSRTLAFQDFSLKESQDPLIHCP